MSEDTIQLVMVDGRLKSLPRALPRGVTITADNDHLKITLAADSHATIAHTFMSSDSSEARTHQTTRIALAKGAALTLFTLQRQSHQSYYEHRRTILQDADSRLNAYHYTLGAQRALQEDIVSLNAPGAFASLHGLYLGRGTQQVAHHISIDHRAPNGTSETVYRGVLDDASKGVFDGKIVVHPNAQKTDATQTNKNLLLSNDAEVSPKPQFEIFADDVKCSHGATVGELDPDAMFYLRSRGIDDDHARALLTYAFAAESTSAIKDESLRKDALRFIEAALNIKESPSCLP